MENPLFSYAPHPVPVTRIGPRAPHHHLPPFVSDVLLCDRDYAGCALWFLLARAVPLPRRRFIPCFHSIACHEDAMNLLRRRGSCPVCREPIEDVEEGEFAQVCLVDVMCCCVL